MAQIGSRTALEYARSWTVTIPSLKGGVGKSTVTAQLADLSAKFGLTVLVVDLDPNGGVTSIMGADAGSRGRTIRDFLDENETLDVRLECVQVPKAWQPDATIPFHEGGALVAGGALHVIPSGPNVSESVNRPGSQAEGRLRDALAKDGFGDRYDIIFVDAPGFEGAVLHLALHAAQHVIFPLNPESLGLKGFSLMIKSATRFATPETPLTTLNGVGAIVTKHSKNLTEHREVIAFAQELLSQELPTARWIGHPVPGRAAISEAVSFQMPVSAQDAWKDTLSNRTRVMDAASSYVAITIAVIRDVLGDQSADLILAEIEASNLVDYAKNLITSGVGVTATSKEQ